MNNILVIGTNDVASACSIRLYRAGFGICMVGWKVSFDLFSFRNFSPTLQQGSKSIENIKASSFANFLVQDTSHIELSINKYIDFVIQNREICVLTAGDLKSTDFSKFTYCINCDDDLFEQVLSKISIPIISCGRSKNINADYYIGTSEVFLGRVKYPFLDFDEDHEHENDYISIISKTEGVFIAEKSSGDPVIKNEKIASIGNEDVYSLSDGYISGAVNSGLIVNKGREIIRLTTDAIKHDISELPVKAFSIAGGVLEAVLFDINLSNR